MGLFLIQTGFPSVEVAPCPVQNTDNDNALPLDANPWFVAKDVLEAVGLDGFASQHTKRLDPSEVLTVKHDSRILSTIDVEALFDSKAPSAMTSFLDAEERCLNNIGTFNGPKMLLLSESGLQGDVWGCFLSVELSDFQAVCLGTYRPLKPLCHTS